MYILKKNLLDIKQLSDDVQVGQKQKNNLVGIPLILGVLLGCQILGRMAMWYGRQGYRRRHDVATMVVCLKVGDSPTLTIGKTHP